MKEELEDINSRVREMTDNVRNSIIKAVDAVVKQDGKLAREIIDSGDEIDDMEDEINSACFRFLATQSPVAGDLRYCISTMKMIRDLERMGDHCEDLSKYAMRLEGCDIEESFVDIPRMAEMASRMAGDAIRAFLERDLRLARKVWKADEEVDEIFREIIEDQMKKAKNGKDPEVCVSLSFIAAHLERIADYATNICEEAIFVKEGEFFEMD